MSDLQRYKQVIIVTDQVITAAYMEPSEIGPWVKFTAHRELLLTTLDEVLTDEAFETHKADNERMFGKEDAI